MFKEQRRIYKNPFNVGEVVVGRGPGNGIKGDLANSLAPLYLSAAPQALSGAGAALVSTHKTNWTTTSTDALTLANGTVVGQMKLIQLIVDGGTGTLTPTSFADGTSIAFADTGDAVLLQWNGTAWRAIDLYNLVDGATAPAIT